MVTNQFEVGDLVWAKMKGFPPWPAKIVDPPPNAPKAPKIKKGQQYYVYFFGSKNYAWIIDENITLHDDKMVQQSNKRKSASFQSAVEEILNCSKHKTKDRDSEIETEEEAGHEIVTSAENSCTKKSVKKIIKCTEHKKVVQKKTVKKRSFSLENGASDMNSLRKSARSDHDYSELLANVPPNIGYDSIVTLPFNEESRQSPHPLAKHEVIDRPITPPFDIETVSEILKAKKIVPTSKSIGFLGLGMIGKGIVKNLLNSGHTVTVWNKTHAKCEPFVRAGALLGETPADVVAACDITFCCVADSYAVKCIVFGNTGVLRGLEGHEASNKGYVELSTIDPETSETIATEINLRGARYLEAPITGSKLLAENGALLVIAAGNQSLFKDCETCFRAMSKDTYYIEDTPGAALKMSIAHSMLRGTIHAALSEAMALVDGCSELKQADLQSLIDSGPFNCSAITEKAAAIVTNNFATDSPLRHMTKDLALAMSLSDTVHQPLPIAAAANEIYKHAQLLGYKDHDVISVYLGVKH